MGPNPDGCECGSQNGTIKESCCRTVIECKPPKKVLKMFNREKFKIRYHAPDANLQRPNQSETLNLSLFGRAHDPKLESEVHPDFDDIPTLEDVRWLSLDFPSAKGKKSFLTRACRSC